MIDYEKKWINEDVIEYKFVRNGQTKFTFENFMGITKNQDDSYNFTEAMYRALRDSQKIHKAYFWECPAIRQDTLDNQFQFVTVRAPVLSQVEQNYASFEEHFHGNKSKAVISFKNLGGDAIMVVPTPKSGKDFTHIANFNENADRHIRRTFWEKVAEELNTALKDGQPRWLSTNGMGVYYLHIRIDSNPKYYQYKNYKSLPVSSVLQAIHSETNKIPLATFSETTKTTDETNQTYFQTSQTPSGQSSDCTTSVNEISNTDINNDLNDDMKNKL